MAPRPTPTSCVSLYAFTLCNVALTKTVQVISEQCLSSVVSMSDKDNLVILLNKTLLQRLDSLQVLFKLLPLPRGTCDVALAVNAAVYAEQACGECNRSWLHSLLAALALGCTR